MPQDANALIWIDLEMTGLDPERERIIEIASIVTDSQLDMLEEGPVIAIHQTDEFIENMDAWNTRTHHESGLVDRVRKSSIEDAEAEQLTLKFIRRHVPQGASPLCGNSIAQDRRFLRRYMPALANYLHYRNLDVSTIKELAMRWYPSVYSAFNKQNTHRALDDIRESIEELRYYRSHLFKS